MPGYQRKLEGRPPSPPYWCALCMAQDCIDGVEYFVETGVFAEHEGVIYLCSKCFEPLVDLSEKFVPVDDHEAQIKNLSEQFERDGLKLTELTLQSELLHDLFGLRLSDLVKFKELTNKLDHLQGAVGLMETKKSERSATELLELQEVKNRNDLIASLDSQIESRRSELNVFIEESLATKLGHIGRADLIPILLNNQLPESVTNPSNADEREADEDSRESSVSGASFGF